MRGRSRLSGVLQWDVGCTICQRMFLPWQAKQSVLQNLSFPNVWGRNSLAERVQAIPLQPAMQSMPQMLSLYAAELNNTASAAGYWAERLGADEQQRSYLVVQQVRI